jgi:hypothetical protein
VVVERSKGRRTHPIILTQILRGRCPERATGGSALSPAGRRTQHAVHMHSARNLMEVQEARMTRRFLLDR